MREKEYFLYKGVIEYIKCKVPSGRTLIEGEVMRQSLEARISSQEFTDLSKNRGHTHKSTGETSKRFGWQKITLRILIGSFLKGYELENGRRKERRESR